MLVARGQIYWTVGQSIKHLWLAMFGKLDNESLITQFEQAFAGTISAKDSVCFPHARIGVKSILETCGFSPGDKIVLSPISIKGMLEVVLELGLEPIFCDLDLDTCNYDAEHFEEILENGPRFVLITPLFGLSSDVGAIVEKARHKSCTSIIDFSQALNAKYDGDHLWSNADYGVYSASSIKTLDTLGGGIVVSRQNHNLDALRNSRNGLPAPSRRKLIKFAVRNVIRNFFTQAILGKSIYALLAPTYLRFKPNEFFRQTGTRSSNVIIPLSNEWYYRYTSVQASLGLAKLTSVHTEDVQRIFIAKQYLKMVRNSKIQFPRSPELADSTYWQMICFTDDPAGLQRFLLMNQIDTGATSLSFLPKIYEKYCTERQIIPKQQKPNLSAAETIYKRSLFLPCYPRLNQNQLGRIIDLLNEY